MATPRIPDGRESREDVADVARESGGWDATSERRRGGGYPRGRAGNGGGGRGGGIPDGTNLAVDGVGGGGVGKPGKKGRREGK